MDYNTYKYADDTSIFCQDKDVMEIKNLCDWFVDNKLLIHFGEDKTKTFFSVGIRTYPSLT